jgi:iron complex outermembrane recepter protein
MNTVKIALPFCIVAAPFMTLSSPLLAAQSASTSLETVVVTATREARSKQELPEAVQVFDQDIIDAVSPSHPSEILNRAAGVHVNNLGGEGHMTSIRQPISTRGVYLYLEDGIPIRPTGFFNHNSLYEVNVPQSGVIEVTKGPASALYGSDAIGGVINSITRTPPEKTEAKLNLEAGSDQWRRGLLSFGSRQGAHSAVVNLNTTRNDSFRDQAKYSRDSLTARWDYQADSGLNVKSLLSYTEVDQSGVSSLEQADYKNDTEKNRFQGNTAFREVEALRVSSEISWQPSDQELLTLTPYYRDNTTSMSPSWMVSYDPNVRESQFQSFGLLSKYRINSSDSVQWIMGVDLDYTTSQYQEEAVSHTLEGDIYTGFTSLKDGVAVFDSYNFDAEQTSVSPYVHVELQMTDRLLASFGVRYDHFSIDYEDNLSPSVSDRIFIPQLGRPVTHQRPEDQTVKFSEWSPKLGLVYQLSDGQVVYFNARHGFSIPSVGTLFRSGSTRNTDQLEPISADSVELGLKGELASWLRYELAVYQMNIKDDIISVVNGFERNVFNAGETQHRGVEISLNGALGNEWVYAVAFSQTEQKYDTFSYTCCFPSQNIDVSGNEIGKAPDTIANVSLAYAPKAIDGLRLEIEWEHLSEYYTDETNSAEYDGHDLMNFRASYRLNAELEFYGRVQNLTDERYSTYTSNQVGDNDISYRPGTPRSVYAGVRYTF